MKCDQRIKAFYVAGRKARAHGFREIYTREIGTTSATQMVNLDAQKP